MMKFDFKIWFESADYYDKNYRYDIDREHGQNPKVFSHWFPEGQDRVYVPFSIDGDDQQVIINNVPVAEFRKRLNTTLNNFKFNLVDYRKGLVSPIDNPKRQQRIMPILQDIAKKAPAVQELAKTYEQASLRLNPGPNPFSIVISQDPHDIALMTYDRPWKMQSCMRLKDDKDPGGAKWHHVYDEVREGGLIAYLCDIDDKEIKKPYSRVLLRRFNNKAKDIALCEETVYGLQVPGFLKAVKDWVDSKQAVAFGKFTRKGSDWSDTFGHEHMLAPKYDQITKEHQPQLKEMMYSLNLEEFLKASQSIIAKYKDLDPEFIGEIFDMVNDKFAQHPEASKMVVTNYPYYIGRTAEALNLPLNKLEHIVKSYTIESLLYKITSFHDKKEEILKYLMPLLMQNKKVHDTNLFAEVIERNKILQTPEFINSISMAAVEEMVHFISNDEVKYMMTMRMINLMKKHLPPLIKRYEDGDEDVLDTITDEWIGPIQELLPRNKISDFMQTVKDMMPRQLYNRLYGHSYR